MAAGRSASHNSHGGGELPPSACDRNLSRYSPHCSIESGAWNRLRLHSSLSERAIADPDVPVVLRLSGAPALKSWTLGEAGLGVLVVPYGDRYVRLVIYAGIGRDQIDAVLSAFSEIGQSLEAKYPDTLSTS